MEKINDIILKAQSILEVAAKLNEQKDRATAIELHRLTSELNTAALSVALNATDYHKDLI